MKSLLKLTVLIVSFTPLLAAALTFKIATVAPDGTNWMKQIRAGADEVEQRTGGRVKFRFYPGGIMGNDKSVLRKIKVGQLHGGALAGGGLSDIYPDSQIYSLPFSFRDLAEVDYVRKHMDPLIIRGLDENGFISFGISEGGFAYMMTKQPVLGVEDLEGKKVWIPEGDRINRAAFGHFGISPVGLPLTDVLTGLQTGLIDTVATSPVGAIALQWHSRVNYLSDTPLLYLYGTLLINKRVFNRLSKADRGVVAEVMKAVFVDLNQQNRIDNEAARVALQKQGIEFVTPPQHRIKVWREGSAEEMDKLSQQGEFSPAMLKTLRKHLTDHRRAVAAP